MTPVCAMAATIDSIKSALPALPPVGAGLVGFPAWAIAALLVVSCGPYWAMAWLDVADRLRDRRGP